MLGVGNCQSKVIGRFKPTIFPCQPYDIGIFEVLIGLQEIHLRLVDLHLPVSVEKDYQFLYFSVDGLNGDDSCSVCGDAEKEKQVADVG